MFENFECTDFTKNEFSQKYLFSDFCSLSLLSDNYGYTISHEIQSKEGILTSILQEIKNKKEKIGYLKKRFG